MSKKHYLITGLALVSLSAYSLQDANAVTITPTISLSISATQSMNFGDLTVNGPGTATINVSGTLTTSGSNITGLTSGLADQAGNIAVFGASGLAVDLSITAGASLSNTAGGTAVPIGSFNLETSAGGSTATVTIPAAGSIDVPLGATLTFAGTENTGSYVGSVTVTGNYQ